MYAYLYGYNSNLFPHIHIYICITHIYIYIYIHTYVHTLTHLYVQIKNICIYMNTVSRNKITFFPQLRICFRYAFQVSYSMSKGRPLCPTVSPVPAWPPGFILNFFHNLSLQQFG